MKINAILLSLFASTTAIGQTINFTDYDMAYVLKFDMGELGNVKMNAKTQQTRIGNTAVQKNSYNSMKMKFGDKEVDLNGDLFSMSSIVDLKTMAITETDLKPGAYLTKNIPADQIDSMIKELSSQQNLSTIGIFKAGVDYQIGDKLEQPFETDAVDKMSKYCGETTAIKGKNLILRVDQADATIISASAADTIQLGQCRIAFTMKTSIDPKTSAYFDYTMQMSATIKIDNKPFSFKVNSALERD